MAVYQRDPDMLPDSKFEPGTVHHLVAGNAARLLDPRRTPVRVVELRPATGMFVVRVEKFEDEGALWELPFEQVSLFQFAKGSRRAANTSAIRDAIARFDQPLRIARDLDALPATLARIAASPAELGDLAKMDAAFARQFASNPGSGEMVKGHCIVLAELGLVTYEGTVVRDPQLFAGAWNRARRAEHIVRRLALVRSIYREPVRLYRGIRGTPGRPRNRGFISATFDVEVAKSQGEVLLEQLVPVERLFMTWRETPQLSERFQESEAVLLFDETNTVF
jgi:hypothetical protein